jgi:EAL domain-containing protein (putative c-di-GMP-specific phosphodiesterase class I)
MVRLSDRRPISLEVLARLEHPRHGMLAPEHFVPQMEDAGLARRLTERVAALAFGDHTRYLAKLDLRLALNLPLDVLLDNAALSALDAQREAAGIAAAPGAGRTHRAAPA